MKGISRRAFIRRAVAAGAATVAFPTVLTRRAEAAWARGSRIHPNIDNLKVVGIIDPLMTTEYDVVSTWARQEELVNERVIYDNMDRLASKLTGFTSRDGAWKSILIKPPGKSWSDVVVAIKTNNIAEQHTRSPVMSKICRVLYHTIGISPGNIHIYDASHGGDIRRKTPFAGLPPGCRIEGKWGGIFTSTKVGEPWKGRSSKCLSHLVRDKVDILINISLCKGHNSKFGRFTMTMKNHFGTFKPKPGHAHDGADYLIAINQTTEILGKMDRSGKVVFPRQQLCIVDALWASKQGPTGLPTAQPNCLIMGVFSPVVDFQVATQLRAGKLNWPINRALTSRFLTDFGYTERDLPNRGIIIGA